MRRLTGWLAVLILLPLAIRPSAAVPRHHEGTQNVKYGFLITIDTNDKRGDVVNLIRGNGSVLDLVEGRDQETDGTSTWFNRYVLNTALLPAGTPEIPCNAWVGINDAVPAVVRNEFSQNSTLWRSFEFHGYQPPVDRAYMKQRLRQAAGFDGVTNIWEITPGDALTGDLLSHFVPLF